MKKLLLFLLLPIALWAAEPQAVYLTWKRDPDTTMIVQWLIPTTDAENTLKFRKVNEEIWVDVKACKNTFRVAPEKSVFTVELTNLTPDTTYEFTPGKEAPTYKFHTLPKDLSRPVRFVAGGDMYHDSLETLKKTNLAAAKTNPDFALVGGDIAYAANKYSNYPENTARWFEWISAWTETMVTPEGHLIPILAALGNHDVNGRYLQPPEQASTFYTLFAAMPGPQGYNVLDFGNYLSVIILDSGHTHPIEGKQTEWLQAILEFRKRIPHKFALYHVPAYPSVRKMNTKMSPNIRQHWVPLFEKYQITAAFEHHDHSYKRTHLIREEKVVPEGGVLYLGDGGWGANKTRKPQERWYLAKTVSACHFIQVTLDKEGRTFTAIDCDGNTIDSYSLKRI